MIGRQVFIGSAGGVVHALRADTGCLQWTFQANGPIRSAIVAAPSVGKQLLLFGDLTGWFYALDAANGQLVWRKRPDEHEAVRISAPPFVHDGIAYVVTAAPMPINASYRPAQGHPAELFVRTRVDTDAVMTSLRVVVPIGIGYDA